MNRSPRIAQSLIWIMALAAGLYGWSGVCLGAEQEHRTRNTGPWDMPRLAQPTPVDWGKTDGLLQEVYYQNEDYAGHSTRVFGWYARPKSGEGPFPAMLLVHGGGGKAFAEWATLWAERGYVALAMDTAGVGPDGQRLPDGGPGQSDEEKFGDFSPDTVNQMWTYHAVAAIVRGHNVLASRTEVDPKRIGITGISWGGYLTCLAASIDDRLRVAVPVYGCGFLQENSAWLPRFAGMSSEQRDRWVSQFDPSRYLAGVTCPILFVNGTNDFAYTLDSYQKSYRLVPGRVDLCITVNMPHGHVQGWTPREIGAFVDAAMASDLDWPRISSLVERDAQLVAPFSSATPLVDAELHYCLARGPWQRREWKSVRARVEADQLVASIPGERPIACFLTAKHHEGLVASTDYLLLSGPAPVDADLATRLDETRNRLASSDPAARLAAVESLIHSDLTERSIDDLLVSLGDADGRVRSASATALGNQGELAIVAVEKLITTLQGDEFKEARETAARALGRIGKTVASERRGFEALQAAAEKDVDPVTRVVALGALAMWEDSVDERVHALTTYLEHDEPLVRMKAAHALGMIGAAARSAAPKIVAALQRETDSHRRGYIARALGNTGDPASLEALREALGNETDAGAKGEIRGAIEKLQAQTDR